MLSLVKPGSPGMEDDKRTQQPPSQACPGARVARARPLPRRKTLEGGEGDRKRNRKWLWLHGGQSATWQPLSLHTTWCRWQQVRVVSCQLPKAGRWMPSPSPCRRAPRAHACGSVSSLTGGHTQLLATFTPRCFQKDAGFQGNMPCPAPRASQHLHLPGAAAALMERLSVSPVPRLHLSIDPGQPTPDSCRYSTWRQPVQTVTAAGETTQSQWPPLIVTHA